MNIATDKKILYRPYRFELASASNIQYLLEDGSVGERGKKKNKKKDISEELFNEKDENRYRKNSRLLS